MTISNYLSVPFHVVLTFYETKLIYKSLFRRRSNCLGCDLQNCKAENKNDNIFGKFLV